MIDVLRRRWNDWTLGAPEAATRRARGKLAEASWPPSVIEALQRLHARGWAAYLVGGTVRDALMGRPVRGSVDVATAATPDEVMSTFSRVEPTGLAHGTVLILDSAPPIESTTFRREGVYTDARRPDRVAFTADPLEDLDRRDLTLNAMAFDPCSQSFLDPHHGALDLERGRLRAVGDPLDRFREDGLRPLRVARFAATLGMEPDREMEDALSRIADPDSGFRADGVAMERVRDELEKLMGAPKPSVGLEWLRACGLLERWLPELARCRGVVQNRFHAFDVYFHSLYTCDAAPPDKPAVRWAALLHDIGKPDTRVERKGDGTFYHHETVGAELADRLLDRLRFPAELRAAIVHLIREHMFDYRPEWSDGAVRRWLRHVGPESVADLFDLRIADALGNGLRQGFPHVLDPMRERIQRLLAESSVLRVADLAIDGHDVMRVLGIGAGPEVGEVLERMLQDVLDRPERNTRTILLERVNDLRSRTGGSA